MENKPSVPGADMAPEDFKKWGYELDGFNENLLKAVNATGKIFMSHTRLRNRFSLRIAIGNLRTTREHVKSAWDLLRQETNRMLADFKPGDL